MRQLMDSLSASNNNLVQSQLCGRQTVVKREKVYKCFVKNCTYNVNMIWRPKETEACSLN